MQDEDCVILWMYTFDLTLCLQYGVIVIRVALIQGNEQMVLLLLKYGADVTAKACVFYIPLHLVFV